MKKANEVIVIDPNGMKVDVVKIESDELYDEFKTIIGGYLENVTMMGLPRPYTMVVDEEGLIKELPLNVPASLLYGPNSPIAGKCIICKMVEGLEGPEWGCLTGTESLLVLIRLESILMKALEIQKAFKGVK